MVIKKCLYCGKPFPNSAYHRTATFCSKSCANYYRWKDKVNMVTCSVCGKLFKCQPFFKRKYCSHACYGTSIKGRKSPWNRGTEKIEKQRIKISGEKHFNWQGGKSFEPYSVSWKESLKALVRCRDNNKCSNCGNFVLNGDVHHIDYNKKNCVMSNLITLCHSCHSKTNHGERDYWTNYFKERASVYVSKENITNL
jgi:5-methylcytosine-specific restriction endonuclease McrA